jgi:branched-chain amino acid transport system ATP-binding protein
MMGILETHGLTMEFRGFRALDRVDLRIEPGELRAVIGPNGAGKTTLFNLLSGLLRPTRGRIQFGGRDVTGLSAHELARRGIARSFQITSVFPRLSNWPCRRARPSAMCGGALKDCCGGSTAGRRRFSLPSA